MSQVDFLPFAVGSGANVEPQSSYAAEASLLANGFQSGVAPSAKFNKALRQSSIMSAVLANFIADLSGLDVIDDGTITTILARLKSVIGGRPGHTYTANDWAYIDKAQNLIIEWGTGTVNGSGDLSVTLPQQMAAAPFIVIPISGQNINAAYAYTSASGTGFVLPFYLTTTGVKSTGGFNSQWLAIGVKG